MQFVCNFRKLERIVRFLLSSVRKFGFADISTQ